MSKNIIIKYLTKIYLVEKYNMTTLITGSSGFIGTNIVLKFNKNKKLFYTVVELNNPYLKIKNFSKLNLCNKKKLEKIFIKKKLNILFIWQLFQVC